MEFNQLSNIQFLSFPYAAAHAEDEPSAYDNGQSSHIFQPIQVFIQV